MQKMHNIAECMVRKSLSLPVTIKTLWTRHPSAEGRCKGLPDNNNYYALDARFENHRKGANTDFHLILGVCLRNSEPIHYLQRCLLYLTQQSKSLYGARWLYKTFSLTASNFFNMETVGCVMHGCVG